LAIATNLPKEQFESAEDILTALEILEGRANGN
jgi:hypothetical protein